MLRFFLFALFCSCINARADNYIREQDQARCLSYARDREESGAQPFTHNITRKLTDSSQIDYNRTATDGEREIIYKAMIGGVIVHGLVLPYTKAVTGHAAMTVTLRH